MITFHGVEVPIKSLKPLPPPFVAWVCMVHESQLPAVMDTLAEFGYLPMSSYELYRSASQADCVILMHRDSDRTAAVMCGILLGSKTL